MHFDKTLLVLAMARASKHKPAAGEQQASPQPMASVPAPTVAAAESIAAATPQVPSLRPRAIPVLLKRQDLSRAGYQCEFVSADGRRCAQKTGLEIDHHQPFAWGGEHSLHNLTLLCHSYHRRKTVDQQGPWVGHKKA